MSGLKHRLENIKKALKQLELRIEKFKTLQTTNPIQENLWENQENVIKCFEICFELLWKTLKDYLEEKHGLIIISPKKVIHECEAVAFINDEETKVLFAMVKARNATVHEYNPDLAEDVTENIIDVFFPLMNIIIERLTTYKNSL